MKRFFNFSYVIIKTRYASILTEGFPKSIRGGKYFSWSSLLLYPADLVF